MTRSFYEVLEVPADASQEAIRDAYRSKVKECHPDVSEDPDAEEEFKRVKRAEEVLGDPDERARYDRLGHDRYVDGAVDPGAGGTTVHDADDVRAAAASAAGTEHDAGGRSAGWRERERRARRGGPADWFENDAGYDADSAGRRAWRAGTRGWGEDGADDAPGTAADAAAGSAGSASAAAAGNADDRRARAGGHRGPAGAAAAGADAAAADDVGPAAASGRGHAATEAWGHRESRRHTHAVHGWHEVDVERARGVPELTQAELVFVGASILVYPLLLAMTVFPPFPTVANVVLGLLTLAYVAFLLPRPILGLPVFGVWSVGIPALLVALGVPAASLVGAVSLVGVWVPFLYSAAVAYVLME